MNYRLKNRAARIFGAVVKGARRRSDPGALFQCIKLTDNPEVSSSIPVKTITILSSGLADIFRFFS